MLVYQRKTFLSTRGRHASLPEEDIPVYSLSKKNICYHRNVMTYKIIKRLCPENRIDKYFPISCLSSYNTRNSQDLQIHRCKTEISKENFHSASLKV